MNQIKTNLLIFLRNLRHAKGFFFVTVLGLSAGLLCTVIMALLVQSETSFDKFHKNLDNLHQVYLAMEGKNGLWTENPLPGAVADHLKARYPEVKAASNFMLDETKVQYNENIFMTQYAFVHPDFFSMFSFDIKGTSRNLLTDPQSCVLEKKMAQKLFGSKDPIGEMITMYGNKQFRVDAVITVPERSSLQFEILRPFQTLSPIYRGWKASCTRVFVQLKEGVSAELLAGKICQDYQINAGVDEAVEKIDMNLHPFAKLHLYTPGKNTGRISLLYLFGALGLFILIMGCVNFINLSTARATVRAKEIGMKKILGANRRQITIQFLTESLALTFVALLLALLASKLLLPFINSLLGTQEQLNLNWAVVGILPIILLATALLAGGYPAFILSRLSSLSIIKGSLGTNSPRKGGGIRKGLVAVQFAFTIFFIISIYTVYRQIDFLMNKPLGFRQEHTLVLRSSSRAMSSKYAVVKQTLLSRPYIASVTRAETSFVSQQGSSSISWEGKAKPSEFAVDINNVDSEYSDFFGLELSQGRFFMEGSSNDLRESFVINESAVKAMGVADPIGMRVVFAPGIEGATREGVVIGVVKDYHTESLGSTIRPKILAMGDSSYWYIRYKPGVSQDILSDVNKTIQPLLPGELIQLSFFNETISQMYKDEQTIGRLLSFLTVLAFILSGVGLFSLGAFFVDRKQKEIGIRKTLGASSSRIALSFVFDHLKPIFWAFLIITPVSWYAGTRVLAFYAYQFDFTFFGVLVTGLMVIGFAILSIGFQALKASTLKPVNVLCRE